MHRQQLPTQLPAEFRHRRRRSPAEGTRPAFVAAALIVQPNRKGLSRRALVDRLGLQMLDVDVRAQAEVERAFERARVWGAQALVVANFAPLGGPLIPALAARSKLPAVFGQRSAVENGGLMSHRTDARPAYRRMAWHVARILNGANPGDLPVEQSTSYEFVVNRKTLADLGLTLPPQVTVRVTEWLE